MNRQRDLVSEYARYRTRRWFFKECGVGLASIAAMDLMSRNACAAPSATNPLLPKKPHHAGKAKRVIYLFMGGAPSHLELFDNKPELAKWDGKLPSPDLLKGYRPRSSIRTASCWDRSTSLPATARAARRSASCCRISRAWRMILPSCAR